MSSPAATASKPNPARAALRDLHPSAYERVASMLLALLILLGLIVFCMFIAWLGSRLFVPELPVPIPLEQVGGGISGGFVGESMPLDSPTWQDVAGETDIQQPEFQQTVAAVMESVATRQADLADPNVAEVTGESRGGTRQTGTGNRPGKGFGEGRPGIPPHMRWEIRFPEGKSLEEYARYLDFFKIELGVLGAGSDVGLVSSLSRVPPAVRMRPRIEQAQVMFMTWRTGKLLESDKQLAQRAGLDTEGKTILQFFPYETEQLLLRLERDFRGVEAGKIRKTVYQVEASADGFSYKVVDQVRL